MKDYKVETLIYYSKFSFDRNHLAKASQVGIQAKLKEYGRNGWRLVSTDAASFGSAMYIYLYFEK